MSAHRPATFRTIAYTPGTLRLLDQTRLPTEEVYVDLVELEDVARAIETLVVRGAPAIGITAAFGVALAVRRGIAAEVADARLRRTRPTAVNLFWALDRMKGHWSSGQADAVIGGASPWNGDPNPFQDAAALEAEAQRIYDEDVAASRAMGEIGAALIPDGAGVLTHCNAGALATAELGTALAVVRAAHRAGKRIRVFADETRPVLQGARLTAWELMKDGIDVTLIPDVAVAHLLSEQAIDCAVVGADRIARNGDVANKIGTRGVACLLFHHERPLYVAAPWSTVDLSMATGRDIPIEERAAREVTHVGSVRIAPEGVAVRNPAFDVTPAEWVAGVITERGFTGKDVARGLADQLSASRPRT